MLILTYSNLIGTECKSPHQNSATDSDECIEVKNNDEGGIKRKKGFSKCGKEYKTIGNTSNL